MGRNNSVRARDSAVGDHHSVAGPGVRRDSISPIAQWWRAHPQRTARGCARRRPTAAAGVSRRWHSSIPYLHVLTGAARPGPRGDGRRHRVCCIPPLPAHSGVLAVKCHTAEEADAAAVVRAQAARATAPVGIATQGGASPPTSLSAPASS